MQPSQEGYLLRIFIGKTETKDGMPLYEWIVRRAKHEKISGATVMRGIEGFGGSNQIHTAKILQLSIDLPIIIEMIDTLEKIENFMPILDEVITDGLVALEKVQIRIYRPSKK